MPTCFRARSLDWIGTCGGSSPDRRYSWSGGVAHQTSAHQSRRPTMRLSTFRRPSASELRAFLGALSLLVMALAGSAGSHWS